MQPEKCCRRILIVDDNEGIHGDFRKILETDDTDGVLEALEAELFGDTKPAEEPAIPLQIDSAFQGEEGLHRVVSALREGQPYEVAFVDMRMPPGWDGLETTVRMLDADADLQIVICTAFADHTWSEIVSKVGHSDRVLVLKKPYDAIEVQQLVHALTSKWALTRSARERLFELEREVRSAAGQLKAANLQLDALIDASPVGIVALDPDGSIVIWNRAAEEIFALPAESALGRPVRELGGAGGAEIEEIRRACGAGESVAGLDLQIERPSGGIAEVMLSGAVLGTRAGTLSSVIFSVHDVSQRNAAEKERDAARDKLREAQKLKAVGQLAAGIAHEINTPTQFVGDNVRFLADGFGDLSRLVEAYETLRGVGPDPSRAKDIAAEVEQIREDIDVEYLADEIPRAISQSLDGISRVAEIVRAMKTFSHPGSDDSRPTDINEALQSTVLVARNEWKYVADVDFDLDESLPPVPCHAGELNQVFLNILINAAHAIEEVVEPELGQKGMIEVTSRLDGEHVELRFRDTGKGMPSEVQAHVFDPFFTTKEVGKGTGQGLAIAHGVITQRHGGTIHVESKPGEGTIFVIRLPLVPGGSGEGRGAMERASTPEQVIT